MPRPQKDASGYCHGAPPLGPTEPFDPRSFPRRHPFLTIALASFAAGFVGAFVAALCGVA